MAAGTARFTAVPLSHGCTNLTLPLGPLLAYGFQADRAIRVVDRLGRSLGLRLVGVGGLDSGTCGGRPGTLGIDLCADAMFVGNLG